MILKLRGSSHKLQSILKLCKSSRKVSQKRVRVVRLKTHIIQVFRQIEAFYLQKVCFSDREKSPKLFHLNCDPWEAIH